MSEPLGRVGRGGGPKLTGTDSGKRALCHGARALSTLLTLRLAALHPGTSRALSVKTRVDLAA